MGHHSDSPPSPVLSLVPQGEVLLGCSAGKLAEVKEADADAAAATIKAAQWQVRVFGVCGVFVGGGNLGEG